MVGSIARIFSHALERRASTSYVIGPELSDAMRACRSLQAGGVATTICAWNSESDLAGDNAERCLEEIEAIARAGLDCYVSLKGQDIGFSRHLFSRICQTGRRLSVGIHLDSMGPESAGEMFSLIEDLQGEDSKLGCTIPGRWTRSLADADRAIELGLRVRVVKGQWADPNQPGIDARDGFLRIVDRLAGQLRQAAIATHDPTLARAALERLCASRTACELELLFGLPYQDAMAVAKAMRIPVRLYIPYGYAWLPYALRQVRKNPRIALWIMRDLLRGGSSEINRLLREQAP